MDPTTGETFWIDTRTGNSRPEALERKERTRVHYETSSGSSGMPIHHSEKHVDRHWLKQNVGQSIPSGGTASPNWISSTLHVSGHPALHHSFSARHGTMV